MLGLALVAGLAAALGACTEDGLTVGSGRSLQPIPSDTLALMASKDTSPSAPVLIRTFKKEAEFEIWKMKSDGHYTYLKTYPMCRWSGQLGPKTREGDRQVPEGFYPITPGQMNPNSNYYLSFNVGYPNAYDRAFGRTGGAIMVHGICSSAGCFSMTDAQIAEIYAIAREGFNGGQREIQMQSYPFHMTAENLAKHRLDPNIDFWKQLKNGSDHFEVTKTEPQVGVCGKRYVFGERAGNSAPDGSMACEEVHRDDTVEAAVAQKQAHDDTEVAELVRQGVKPIMLVYDDGGQNPQFLGQKGDVSRPDAITAGPTEIALDEHGKPIPAVMKVAEADANTRRLGGQAWAPPSAQVAVAPAAAKPATAQIVNASLVARSPDAAGPSSDPIGSAIAFLPKLPSLGGSSDAGQPFYKKMLGFSGDDSGAVRIFEPAQPIPADVPLPPRRDASSDAPLKPQAALSGPRLQVAARASVSKAAPATRGLDPAMSATVQ
jgi:murein L,D-transpeptidase YafK